MKERQPHPQPSPPIPKSTIHRLDVLSTWQFVQFFLLMSEDNSRFYVVTVAEGRLYALALRCEHITINRVYAKRCRTSAYPTLRQNLERTVKVLGKPWVQVVGHARGVDLNVSDRVHQDQPEVTAARKTPDCNRSRPSMVGCSTQQQ